MLTNNFAIGRRITISFEMNWPHAPTHWLFEPGLYMVTAGTYQKVPYFNSPERLDYFQETFFACADEFGWSLRAWAILANHYHFIAASPPQPEGLRRFLGKLHMVTAKQINQWDRQPGRKIWHQYWDSRITFEKSYLARLRYVNHNPVKHSLVANAANYRWCSAAWFAENGSPALVKTVNSFKADRLAVPDDF